MSDGETKFGDLAIGERFKFFLSGSLLTKTGDRSYSAPQWGQEGMPADPDQAVERERNTKEPT